MQTVNEPASHWASQWYRGKSVLISGGTSGIGAAIAREFIRAGAEVVCTGVGAAEIEAARCDPLLGRARIEGLDVRDAGAVGALASTMDRLDVLVNCAGIIRRGWELEPDAFAEVVNVNLTGSMRLCAAARPKLAQTGSGSIVNLASMLSFFGGGLVPGYAASKGGIAQMTKSLAIAYATDGIRVNAIAPGWIETPLTRDLKRDPQRSEMIIARTPLRRWGRPEDLSGAVLFLCSPAAAFVTGAILPVDGGYLVA